MLIFDTLVKDFTAGNLFSLYQLKTSAMIAFINKQSSCVPNLYVGQKLILDTEDTMSISENFHHQSLLIDFCHI